ncbi:uncharacterized protein [Amphiura filiformis]|uniref:uncharacterized protein n=1 Tax=Amphiura filiformis TaxID=82378 RepID=UPI003B21EF12
MSRKEQYKHGASGTSNIRERCRGQEVGIRKQRREKLLNSKRVRLEEVAEELEEVEYTVEQVKQTSKALQVHSNDRLSLLKTLKKMFAQGSGLVEAFLSVDNSLRCLVGLLSGTDPALQLEAAWCVTNLSASIHEHCLLALKHAAPYLITYLSGQNAVLQDQCCWALGNIAGDGPECRDTLLTQGALQPMVNLLESPVTSVVQSAAFALSNLARGPGANTKLLIDAAIAPKLLHLLSSCHDNLDLLSEVSWVLTYLTASGEHEVLLESLGIIPNLVSNLVNVATNHPNNGPTITPLVRCLGNICSGPEEYVTMAIQDGRLLPVISHLLKSEHRHVQKETLWALNNMTESEGVCEQVVKLGVLANIVHHLHSTYDIKREAVVCLCNLAYRGPAYCQDILHLGAFPEVVAMLKSHDPDTICLALGFAEMILRQTKNGSRIFEENDGVARLEALEYHGNQTVQQQANELLETYFYQDTEQQDSGEQDDPTDYPTWRLNTSEEKR